MSTKNKNVRSFINPIKNTKFKAIVNPVSDNISSECVNAIKILNLFTKLSNYIESIKILFYEYSLGNISMVASILTFQTYQTISIEFAKLSVNEKLYPKYEKLRKNYVYAITGLYQSLLQNLQLEQCHSRLADALDRASILNDPDKLQKYINNFKSTIFPDTTVQIIAAKIKPEYLEYIKVYGYPSNNIFDPDKLGNIILNLTNKKNI